PGTDAGARIGRNVGREELAERRRNRIAARTHRTLFGSMTATATGQREDRSSSRRIARRLRQPGNRSDSDDGDSKPDPEHLPPRCPAGAASTTPRPLLTQAAHVDLKLWTGSSIGAASAQFKGGS